MVESGKGNRNESEGVAVLYNIFSEGQVGQNYRVCIAGTPDELFSILGTGITGDKLVSLFGERV